MWLPRPRSRGHSLQEISSGLGLPVTSSASTLVVEGRRIPPGQGLEACPQWCPSTLDLPLDHHYSGPHLPCPNCSAPAHALPSSLGGPMHLWATSPTPITQDALCTLTSKISCLAGLQTAASLSLSHSANPSRACLGMLLSSQLSGCISTHYPAMQANPLGLLHPPFVASPTGLGSSTFHSVRLSASPPTATTSPGPSTSLCGVPTSSPSAVLVLLRRTLALAGWAQGAVCLTHCTTGSHQLLQEPCSHLGCQPQDCTLPFHPDPLCWAVGDGTASTRRGQPASVSFQARPPTLTACRPTLSGQPFRAVSLTWSPPAARPTCKWPLQSSAATGSQGLSEKWRQLEDPVKRCSRPALLNLPPKAATWHGLGSGERPRRPRKGSTGCAEPFPWSLIRAGFPGEGLRHGDQKAGCS